MKTYIFLAGLMICFAINTKAQTAKATTQAGIYLNWKDYQSGNVVPGDKMHLNHATAGKCVAIVNEGKTKTYCKDSIFGYRDKEGRSFRFYKSYEDEYMILLNGNLVMYVKYLPTHTSKGVSAPMQPAYFFSTGLNSPIQELTVGNLKKAYPDNIKFHDEIDSLVDEGSDLWVYDQEHKTYKINYLLNK